MTTFSVTDRSTFKTCRELLEERFWAFVDKSAECWLWTGYLNNKGYGQFHVDGRPVYAHRFAWFLATGRWPEPFALHHCDTPACCRVDHLFEGNHQDNTNDKIRKGRQYTKLSREQIDLLLLIRQTERPTYTSLAERFGISYSYVEKLCTGEYRRIA